MTEQAGQPTYAPTKEFGSWFSRVGAFVIDIIPNVVVMSVLTALFGETTTTDNGVSFQLHGWPAVLDIVLTLAWFAYNWLYLQGTTGQTVGKKLLRIAVYGVDGRPIGMGLTFARQLVHIVDAIPCFIGYLWPIWDKKNRTFADMIMSTRVYKT